MGLGKTLQAVAASILKKNIFGFSKVLVVTLASLIGRLLEMATGQKIETTGDQEKKIQIDKDSGEVTMKFKLPGF